ncbi:hypothetical protein DFH08DRAFT_817741 [Mycena albidolilacea]|uniref:Uncharacterized protein n=1 Tax=Mycena albidolilacea TaxID=1033008 RepID=A0AAD7EH59_9AGAR|nr:hypothetical protein DFH08DRAFT_817741 [Mycena albidolilacea]
MDMSPNNLPVCSKLDSTMWLQAIIWVISMTPTKQNIFMAMHSPYIQLVKEGKALVIQRGASMEIVSRNLHATASASKNAKYAWGFTLWEHCHADLQLCQGNLLSARAEYIRLFRGYLSLPCCAGVSAHGGIARRRSAAIITADSVAAPRLSARHGGAARQIAPRNGLKFECSSGGGKGPDRTPEIAYTNLLGVNRDVVTALEPKGEIK